MALKQNIARKPVNLRVQDDVRQLIDRAAALRGTSRSNFMIDAARQAAEQAILDQTVIVASPEAYAEFLQRLDATPNPNEPLRRTMRQPAPWR